MSFIPRSDTQFFGTIVKGMSQAEVNVLHKKYRDAIFKLKAKLRKVHAKGYAWEDTARDLAKAYDVPIEKIEALVKQRADA